MKLYFTVQRLKNRHRAAIWKSETRSLQNTIFLCSINVFDSPTEAARDGRALLQFAKIAHALSLRPYQQIVIDSLTAEAGGRAMVPMTLPMGAGKAGKAGKKGE